MRYTLHLSPHSLPKSLRPLPTNPLSTLRPYSSTTSPSPPSKHTHLLTTLPSRHLPLLHDYLTPQPSHLLSTSLASFLPIPPYSTPSQPPSPSPPILPTTPPPLPSTTSSPTPLPPTHHIAYFPTPTPHASLLPDGTDTLHSPGPPFTRRLWAGGSIRFPCEHGGPLLDGRRAVCVEGIRDVQIKGAEGGEKVFVGIERRIARISEDERSDDEVIRARLWPAEAESINEALIIERRNLVFLRPHSSSSPSASPQNAPPSQSPRQSLLPSTPSPSPLSYTHTLPPTTPSLLFRYSALMFNAHSIHLDTLSTRNMEGHPNLLVHGPLLLTIMVGALDQQLKQEASEGGRSKRVIREVEYRNLKPVYVGESMRVAGQPRPRRPSKPSTEKGNAGGRPKENEEEGEDADDWEVWIEVHGEMAVRGTVKTERVG
ncbi:MAG: hypothetical protein Q9160_002375 [Pyrenula sp. 1 TL-2023]